MVKTKAPKPLLAGVIYGEVARWVLLTSLAIAVVGLIIYMISGGYLARADLLDHLWRGCDCGTIWQQTGGGVARPPTWYCCLGMLSKGDMVAMVGIAFTAMAAVAGMWGAFFGMIRSKGGIYILFALIVAVLLTLSASGLITLA